MPKIEIESGQLSAATHRLTRPSSTLDRRYVRRPTNIAIREAAQHIQMSPDDEPSAPSRLVNLRVHATDYEAARQAEEEAEAQRILAETKSITMYPNVVEYGMAPEPSAIATPSVVADTMANPVQPANETSPASDTPTAPAEDTNLNSLAMNIAADYAAATLGTTVTETTSVSENTPPANLPTDGPADVIAQAAAEAIASIRTATNPDQVSEQVASLKTFAENLKGHDSPEMRELSSTIDKFVHVAMKSTKIREEVAEKERNTVKVELPAKVNRAAAKVTRTSEKVIAANRNQAPVTMRKNQMRRNAKGIKMPTNKHHTVSPEELKDRAIEQALHSVATMDEARKNRAAKPALAPRRKFRARHFAVAFVCATVCVASVIYAISTNIPDISVKVAAMQTGIQATYPSYIPRDYSLENIASEDGKITMTFSGPDNTSFSLVEEKSSWDSAALLRNFVEPTWSDKYTTTHEQGITIYISNTTSDAAWVNGGVLYKITSDGTSLTKKQVRNIVVSL